MIQEVGIMTRVTGEKNSFLPTWKLIFTTLEFYRDCRPIKWEYHLCTRSWHESFARVTGVKNSFLPNVEIDFYYLGVYRECHLLLLNLIVSCILLVFSSVHLCTFVDVFQIANCPIFHLAGPFVPECPVWTII